MLPVVAISNNDEGKTLQKFIKDYARILYPDHDMESNTFETRATEIMSRYFGEPFRLSLVGDQSATLLPTSGQMKAIEEEERKKS